MGEVELDVAPTTGLEVDEEQARSWEHVARVRLAVQQLLGRRRARRSVAAKAVARCSAVARGPRR